MAQKLIVEGTHDAIVLTQLFIRYGIKPPKGYRNRIAYKQEFIVDAKGITHINAVLEQQLNTTDVTNLGIILDANDKGAKARLDKIEKVISTTLNLSEPLHLEPTENGTIWKYKDQLTVGIWIMPDNASSGYLEHFVASMIDEKDKVWQFAQEKTDEILNTNYCLFTEAKQQKAALHTYLAWQEHPGLTVNTAIEAKYFRNKSPLTNRFVTWFKNTFELEE